MKKKNNHPYSFSVYPSSEPLEDQFVPAKDNSEQFNDLSAAGGQTKDVVFNSAQKVGQF